MCIAYGSKANTNKVMHIVWSTKQKEKSLKTEKLFANITYYKLQARKHFVYYIIDLGSKGYRVGGIEEILDQVLMILRVFGG